MYTVADEAHLSPGEVCVQYGIEFATQNMEHTDDVFCLFVVGNVLRNVRCESVQIRVDRRAILTSRVFRRECFKIKRGERRCVRENSNVPIGFLERSSFHSFTISSAVTPSLAFSWQFLISSCDRAVESSFGTAASDIALRALFVRYIPVRSPPMARFAA